VRAEGDRAVCPGGEDEGTGRKVGDRFLSAALIWLVFSSGVAVMGLEMSASRLIAPYFGSTLSVWTSLIGLVLAFLTAGYYLGGRLADRYTSARVLGGLVMAAGVLTLLVPVASKPILEAAWSLTPRAGLLFASLLGTFALFSMPTMLLGCVCPYAMKLSIVDLGQTGRVSARIYAVSAIGSVVGTFVPALVTIPAVGVRRSIMVFGVLLVVAAVLLLGRLRFLPMAVLAGLALAIPLPPIALAEGAIATEESAYNYLQVVDTGDARLLVVDWGAFSCYAPGEFRTHEYFDYLLLGPLLRPEPPGEWLHSVLIIGLGAGTVSKQITQAYGPVAIDGVEVDPAIVDLGRRFFEMNEPNLRVHVSDGRAFLAGCRRRYNWVVIDAYQGSDIPFHLVTREFFETLREHMTPGGVFSVNVAWWRPGDAELLRRVAATVEAVFPSVCVVTGMSRESGAVLLAGGEQASPDNIVNGAEMVGHEGLTAIAEDVAADTPPHISVIDGLGTPLTDDRAPIDEIADRLYREARQEAHQRERKALAN
jgi:spermidine synthase